MFKIFYFLVPDPDTSYNETSDHGETLDDWSKYQPSMLQKPTSSPLRANNDETIIIEFTDGDGETYTDKKSISQSIPSSIKMPSRRRPVLQEKQNVLVKSRLKTLEIANEQATEEHAIKIRILLLQEQQEIEKLEQEQLRTKILRQEFENLTK